MVLTSSSPFGGQTRTRVLVALGLLESSYPRELARLLEAPISGVRKALAALERDGLVSGRMVGRTRLVQINPAYFARDELRAYLVRLAAADRELRSRVEGLRRRPRQAGKPR
jgi:DNA-binding transcriptional ArsR family regulator